MWLQVTHTSGLRLRCHVLLFLPSGIINVSLWLRCICETQVLETQEKDISFSCPQETEEIAWMSSS